MVYIQAPVTSTTPLNTLPTSTRPQTIKHDGLNRAIALVATTSSDRPSTTSLTDVSDSDVTTSAQDAAVSTDTLTQSLIQITALPPGTTLPQTVAPKLAYERKFNVVYLTPLFVALGVVLGIVAVVLLFDWRARRKRLRRASTLEPGPPYAPPENDVEEQLLVHASSMEQVSLFAVTAGTPSKSTVHGSRYIPKRHLAWSMFKRDPPSSYSQPSYAETIIPSIDGERFTVLGQDDPFVVTPTGAIRQSPKELSLPRVRVSPSMQDPGDDPSHHDRAPDSGSPQRFRRSMFDILKLRSAYRPVPNKRPDATRVVPLSGSTHDAEAQRLTPEGDVGAASTYDSQDSLCDMTEGRDSFDGLGILPHQGIHLQEARLTSPKWGDQARAPRIVTLYPSGTNVAPKERENVSGLSENSARDGPTEEKQVQDIYTKAPERRRSRSHSQKTVTGASRRFSAPDPHAAVLPLSPPSLMSPPLEQSLFFTSSLASSTSLGRVNTLSVSSPPTIRRVQRSPETSLFPLPSKKTKKSRKPRTSKPTPPLPSPPYPDIINMQSTSRGRSPSTEFTKVSVSPGSPKPKGCSTSATSPDTMSGLWSHVSLSPSRLALTLGSSPSDEVLSKVNNIVAQGYNMKRTAEGDHVDG